MADFREWNRPPAFRTERNLRIHAAAAGSLAVGAFVYLPKLLARF